MGPAIHDQICNLPRSRSRCKSNAMRETTNGRTVVPLPSNPEPAPRDRWLRGARTKTTDMPVRA
jgi:hypothetical protein